MSSSLINQSLERDVCWLLCLGQTIFLKKKLTLDLLLD